MFDEADPGLAALFLWPLSDASSSGSLSVRELRRLGPFAFSALALVSLEETRGAIEADANIIQSAIL